MRGVKQRTPELIAEAKRLRDAGLMWQQIADRLGISRSTAHMWVTDPTGAGLAVRKDSYRGTCEQCGAPTDGSMGPDRAPRVCQSCLNWTREDVLRAFDAFWEQHSRSPRMIDALRSNRTLPTQHTVERLFGSWNEGLIAAGLPLNRDRDPATNREMAALRATGRMWREIAELYGCTPSNVQQRVARVTNGRAAA